MHSVHPEQIGRIVKSESALAWVQTHWGQERSPTVMLLVWLLAQAPQLQLLHLQHPRSLVVPPIRNLRHLIMASHEFTPTTAASIKQLRKLQTLWLGTPRPEICPGCVPA
ncbi:g3838 [Coccomyxa elongata]